MRIESKYLEIRWTKGKGPGGQHKNKVETCCVMTHRPTNLTVTVDGRSRSQNEKQARKLLEEKIKDLHRDKLVAKRKARRDKVIHDNTRIRTYDFTKNLVIDHRTGKTASLKHVLIKGQLDRLQP